MEDGTEIKKWEYKTLYHRTMTKETGKIEKQLNKLGNKGWELVAVFGATSEIMGSSIEPHLYLFKRELRVVTCPNCSAENEWDAEYCIECGSEL